MCITTILESSKFLEQLNWFLHYVSEYRIIKFLFCMHVLIGN